MFNHFNNYIFTPCAINMICVVTFYNFVAASILFIVYTLYKYYLKRSYCGYHIHFKCSYRVGQYHALFYSYFLLFFEEFERLVYLKLPYFYFPLIVMVIRRVQNIVILRTVCWFLWVLRLVMNFWNKWFIIFTPDIY